MKTTIPGAYRSFRSAWTVLHFVVIAAAVAWLLRWALENDNAVRMFESSTADVLQVQQQVSNVIPWPWGVDGGDDGSGSSSGPDGGSVPQFSEDYQVIGNVNVRSGPDVASEVVTTLSDGAWITVDCTATGSEVDPGPFETQVPGWSGVDSGPTTLWNHVAGLGYVSDAYVTTNGGTADAPACPR
jgi:hypothetical protein